MLFFFPQRLLFLSALALSSAWLCAEDFQGSAHRVEYEEEPILYSKTAPNDAITRLQADLDAGRVKLAWNDKFGYLPAVLEALEVSAASQMLVFSKTSLQRRIISPTNPRALFYNDDVYVGFIPDAPVMEISTADPVLGGVFYTLEQEKVRRPKFVRSDDCISCHGAQRTLGVPGHFVRSVPADRNGELDSTNEFSDIDQCKPISDRWAGWFVSGQHGELTHKGNLIGEEEFARATTEPNFRGNLKDLESLVDTSKYPRATSDIVALMILEHQGKMHNYITRLSYETRNMMQAYGHIRYLNSQVNAFLRYLLFTEEVQLTSPISGDPEFVQAFTGKARRDRKGRSLRDLDMKTRMFRYPCSFLIESPAFAAMPSIMREHLLQRLHTILTGKEADPQFAGLQPKDRQAILEILRDTMPSLPSYWHG